MSTCKCKPPITPNVLRPRKALIGWIVPTVVLVLLPKCPLCFAAYAACFGVCLSVSNATVVRHGLVISCAAVLALMFVRAVNRLVRSRRDPSQGTKASMTLFGRATGVGRNTDTE